MNLKLPYYMVYPFPYMQDNQRQRRRDRDYMKTMYPLMVKRLLPFIEEEVDRLEYEGSMLYDEYPDRLMLRLLCSKVMGNASEELGEDLPRDLIEVLVYEEICERRSTRCDAISGGERFSLTQNLRVDKRDTL